MLGEGLGDILEEDGCPCCGGTNIPPEAGAWYRESRASLGSM